MGRVRRGPGPLLLLPALAVVALVAAVPVGLLVRTALFAPGAFAELSGETSLASFAALFEGPFPAVARRTVRLALLTTAATVVLGYPVAVLLSRARGGWRSFQTLLVVSPLLMSTVVRAYGWTLVLGSQGVLGGFLENLGLPRAGLLHTEAAVLLALTESFLPFMILALAASLDRIEPAVIEAARSLGASPGQTFLRVALPLSVPGLVAGGSFVFVGSLSAYATPALLGGSEVRTWVREIQELVMIRFDWPTAAAASLALLLVAALLLALGAALSHRRSARAFGQ